MLVVGLPGLALPDSALATAMLPSIPDMVDKSIHGSRIARKVSQPAPPQPQHQHGGEGANTAYRYHAPALMHELVLCSAAGHAAYHALPLWSTRASTAAASRKGLSARPPQPHHQQGTVGMSTLPWCALVRSVSFAQRHGLKVVSMAS